MSASRPTARPPAHLSAGASASGPRSANDSRNIKRLEASLEKLKKEVQTQAQDLVGLATGFARAGQRIFILNTVTAAVHFARSNDEGHTACGWPFARVKRHASGPAFRIINNLVDIPGTMLCEKCLPSEHALAMSLLNVDLSGDDIEQ